MPFRSTIANRRHTFDSRLELPPRAFATQIALAGLTGAWAVARHCRPMLVNTLRANGGPG